MEPCTTAQDGHHEAALLICRPTTLGKWTLPLTPSISFSNRETCASFLLRSHHSSPQPSWTGSRLTPYTGPLTPGSTRSELLHTPGALPTPRCSNVLTPSGYASTHSYPPLGLSMAACPLPEACRPLPKRSPLL